MENVETNDKKTEESVTSTDPKPVDIVSDADKK